MNKFKFCDKVWHETFGECSVLILDDEIYNIYKIVYLDGNENYIAYALESKLTLVSDWVKFNINDESTYPPANDSRLIRFNDGTCGTVYVTDNNGDNPLGGGVDKKWAFYSDAGYANLENITHHHPLPAPPTEVTND